MSDEPTPNISEPKPLPQPSLAWRVWGFIALLLRMVLKTILVLFCLVFLAENVSPWVFEVIYVSLSGWALFLWRTLPQVSVNFSLLFSALLASVLAVAGLHSLARWLWQKAPANAAGTASRPAWRLRWSLALSSMVFAMFAASVASAGLGHQVLWLSGESWVYNRSRWHHMEQQNNARQIVISLLNLGEDAGAYPESPLELSKGASPMLEASGLAKLMLMQSDRTSTPEPWLYLGGGIRPDSPADVPVLVAPRPHANTRYPGKIERTVTRNDGSADAILEADYSALIEAYRLRLRAAGSAGQKR